MNSTCRFDVPPLRLALALAAAAVALAACAPAPKTLSPRVFEARWHELVAQRNYPAAAQLIGQRERQLPNAPEAMIARANLCFRQATAPAAGKSVGLDTLLAQRAIDTLHDGVKRFPDRLDVRMGLAFLCQQLGMATAQLQAIDETIAYARDHGESLRWSYGDPLPEPARDYVPQLLRDYVRFYADRGAPGDDQMMMAIAGRVMRSYPATPYVANDVANWFGAHNQWERSLEFLHSAERADSTDGLVLFNLGWANEHLRRRDPAIHYYRRALSVSTAGGQSELAQSATERLTALGVTP